MNPKIAKLALVSTLIGSAVWLSACGNKTAPAEDLTATINQTDQPALNIEDVQGIKASLMDNFFANYPETASSTDSEFLSKYSQAIIHTNLGDIGVKFYNQDAPKTVANFIKLSTIKFYDQVKFHRVIPDFMIQGGDPNSKDDNWDNDGTGGPEYAFEDEINTHSLVEGSLAMANSGPNTNGSQFFIVTAKSTPWLDGRHTNFGEVTSGLEVVRKIEGLPTNENDHPTQDAIINSIELLP